MAFPNLDDSANCVSSVAVSRFKEDLNILAAAVGAGADAIVTGDKDLLTMKNFEGIPIIEVKEALRLLGLETE